MKYLITIILAITALSLLAQNPSKAQFDSLLIRGKIAFNMPENCEEVAVKFMHKIPHNYAVGPKDASFQIRYWIQPLDALLADYNKKSKKQKKESMHPDALCKGMMLLATLNASGNKSRDYHVSPYPAVTKKVYNADWDAVAFFESGWPKEGYKYCYLISVHKDGVANIYIYVLANNKEDFVDISGLMAESIKFQ
ncbi:MAG: hypothetical protein ACRBFS_09595 [Aureispira sp.]